MLLKTKELANYNIGLDEVKETLRWINTVSTVDVPALIHPETITDVVNALTDTRRAASTNVDAHQESCKQQLQYANACNNMLTLHPVVLLCCDALLRSG